MTEVGSGSRCGSKGCENIVPVVMGTEIASRSMLWHSNRAHDLIVSVNFKILLIPRSLEYVFLVRRYILIKIDQ